MFLRPLPDQHDNGKAEALAALRVPKLERGDEERLR
jgi:hypothetical protein